MWDVVIVGGGPAGLMAGCYLGRFRRTALIIDGGRSRARWIPASHNTPGFPQGVSGLDLLGRLRVQALRYGTVIHAAEAGSIERRDGFCVEAGGEVFKARCVLLATGVRDQLPAIPAAEEAVQRGEIKICPICDAYEVVDKPIAVLGEGEHAAREANFLRHYSSRVTLLDTGTDGTAAALRAGVDPSVCVRRIRLVDLSLREGQWVLQTDSGPEAYETLYVALGCRPQADLGAALGAERDESGALKVNAHQETSIPRLYAAGDVVRGLNQIVVAEAEAAIAATHIHNRLREELGNHPAPARS